MRILLKYTIKSIKEKKFRAFLIIFALALAGALFLASSRLSDSIATMYLGELTAAYGDVDLSIYPNESSPTAFMSLSPVEKLSDQIERVIPFIMTSGQYKEIGSSNIQNISINGYNIEDYITINELEVIDGSVEDFSGSKILLSKKGASQLGLSVGDQVSLTIGGGKRKVTVAAIVAAKGLFKSEQSTVQAIMPFDTICRYCNTNNKPTSIYIQLRPESDLQVAREKLQQLYPKYDVREVFNTEVLKENLASITTPFMLMTFIVIFMSVFIIYSSFKVIMLEKLPVVGTFRSVGASKRLMNGILLLEALIYGVVGGIAACILGIGCLYGLSGIMIGMLGKGSMSISISVTSGTYITTFLLCLGMAVLSTLLPVLSVGKISLKDIILNNRPHKSRQYIKDVVIGCILIIIGFLVAMFIKKHLAMIACLIGFFMMIMGIIKVIPVLVFYGAHLLGVIFKMVFGNIGELATKNIKKNKSVLNSITLICIGMSVLLSISTMTQNVSTQVLDFYKDTFGCDILGYVGRLDDQKIRQISRNSNVDTIIKAMDVDYKIPEFKEAMVYGMAIETTHLSPEVDYNIIGDEHELLIALQADRNIIVTEILRKRYDLKVGDELTFEFKKSTRKYTIIGFMDTMWNNGSTCLVPLKYYKKDAEQLYYDSFYASVIQGADPEVVAAELTDSMKDTWSQIITVDYQTKSNQEQNASMMSMISIFAILAMVIGIVGVINNLIISFIERRQNIAMLRAVGMSKKQVLGMIFIEGLGSGIIGGLGGIGAGILVCYMFGYILEALQMPVTMEILPNLFLPYFIGGMLITVMGSILPAKGSSKLNIIEAIKYE